MESTGFMLSGNWCWQQVKWWKCSVKLIFLGRVHKIKEPERRAALIHVQGLHVFLTKTKKRQGVSDWPAGSSAPSGSGPPVPPAVGLSAAAPSVCPWQRSQRSCWRVRPPGCPGERAATHHKNHKPRLWTSRIRTERNKLLKLSFVCLSVSSPACRRQTARTWRSWSEGRSDVLQVCATWRWSVLLSRTVETESPAGNKQNIFHIKQKSQHLYCNSWELQTALKTQFITLFSFSCIAVISQSKEAPPTCCSKLWQPIRTSWLKGRGANTSWFRVWAEGGTWTTTITTVNPAELLEHSPGVKILHISKYISYSELIPTEDGSTRLIYFVPGTLADEIPPFIRAWDWHSELVTSWVWVFVSSWSSSEDLSHMRLYSWALTTTAWRHIDSLSTWTLCTPCHQDLWLLRTCRDPEWPAGTPPSAYHTAESDSYLHRHRHTAWLVSSLNEYGLNLKPTSVYQLPVEYVDFFLYVLNFVFQ